MTITGYYPKRQIIDVTNFETIDFDEKILICVPKFAWSVARSWLSLQGEWKTTYGREYFMNGYQVPSQSEMDTIQANLAEFLEATDMSCDLEAVMLLMVDQLAELVAKECSVQLACNTGSAGASGVEAVQETYEDTGVDPPYGFDTYGEYEAWKCGIAQLIVDQLEADLEYIKDLALVEMSAAVLAGTLLSPIPGDEIGGLVGMLLVFVAEGILDTILSEIIADIIGEGDELVCALFLAVDVPGAKQAFNAWSVLNLSSSAQYVLSYWRGNDTMNRLFQAGNFILPSYDCAACALGEDTIKDTFTDDDDVLLTAHTPELGGPWLSWVGTWTIQDGMAKGGATDFSRIGIDGTLSEGQVSANLVPATGSKKHAYQGLIFRSQDSMNYIHSGWVGGSESGYFITKVVAGVRIQVAFTSAPETYEDKALRITFEGTQIHLYVNEVLQVSKTSSSFQTETNFGMQLGTAGLARLDNFLVQTL